MTVDLWTATLEQLAQPDVDAWDVGPIFVAGTPRPQGSKKGFVVPAKGERKARAIIVNDEPELLKAWRGDMRDRFERAMAEAALEPFTVPTEVGLTFTFQRPQHHHVAGDRSRPVKPSAPYFHTQDPDLDKLLRSVADALTGIVWVNDNLICRYHDPIKLWGLRSGVEIAARRLR